MAISAFWAPVYRALVEKVGVLVCAAGFQELVRTIQNRALLVLCAEANLQNNGALVYMVRALRWLLFCAMHYILSSMVFI